ncbi:MAG: ABC-F family ATP-binding cassette domain-containing protein [Asticcacaulis sp.]
MSASVVLSQVSWTTPDGHALFTHLDLAFNAEKTGLIGRNGVGKSTLLRLITGQLTPNEGRISLNGRIGLLPQITETDPAQTVADAFGVAEDWARLKRIEAATATDVDYAEADWVLEARIGVNLRQMGLEYTPDSLLADMSGGQRTRVLLAALMFSGADIILLDEPTNHLDRQGREALKTWLAGYKGAVIVVSHDRELLTQMDRIVELTDSGAQSYGGNWDHYNERKALDLAAHKQDLAEAQKQIDQITQKSQQIRERKARKDGAGERKRARNDMPRILMDARRNASENTSGDNARLAQKRLDTARDAVAQAREQIEVIEPIRIDMPSVGLPSGREVVRLEAVSAGYSVPVFSDFSLHIDGPERITVTGGNGSGKSTLLSVIAGTLRPMCGRVKVTDSRVILDQEVTILKPEDSIRDNFLRLNAGSDENQCRQALARFRFRADAALKKVGSLSGGEKLRASLACVLGVRPPELLILDEPTNHLDLEAIAAVEAGLKAYDGALIVVSHDEAFLEAVAIDRRIKL